MEPTWIAVIGVLGGALIGVIGQIIGNLINHKKEHQYKIDYMIEEFLFKDKKEVYESMMKCLKEDFLEINNLIKKGEITKRDEKKIEGNSGKYIEIMEKSKLYCNEEINKKFNEYFKIQDKIWHSNPSREEILKYWKKENEKYSNEINEMIKGDLKIKWMKK